MPRRSYFAVLWLFAALSQPAVADVVESPPPKLSAKEEAMSRLFGLHETVADFRAAAAAARDAGLPDLVILDASYFYTIEHVADGINPELAVRLRQIADAFQPGQGVNFSKADDYRALAEHLDALQAEAKGDREGYKTHLLQAVWLSPEHATLFLEPLLHQRRRVAEAARKADMLGPWKRYGDESAVTLDALLGSRGVIALDVWADWCEPSVEALSGFGADARWLAGQGVPLAAVNVDRAKQATAVAAAVKKHDAKSALIWLLEGEDGAFSRALGIDSIPWRVLLDREGGILFSGHPDDPGFLAALQKLFPGFPAEAAASTEPAGVTRE